MVDMSINLGGLVLKNPVTNCSGTFESGKPYADFVDVSKMGAVTCKGMSYLPWEGNPAPRMAEIEGGMLNCIGLQNDGVEKWIRDDYVWLKEQSATIIANIVGKKATDYCDMISRLEQVDVDAYEINISCPNVDCGGASLASSEQSTFDVVNMCRKLTKRPMSVKLNPNVTNIAKIAIAAKDAGADILSLVNSVQGMAIDIKTRTPKLSNVIGGMAGPCMKPIALKCVYQCYQATRLPIIGMGGIMSGEDAIEFMLAGASAIGVGFANFIDPTSCLRIASEIEKYCIDNGIDKVSKLTGALQLD